ncbi:TPA: hypothetical protein ACU0X8_003744, partial [Legionella anisa]
MNKLKLLNFLTPPKELPKELEYYFVRFNHFIESVNQDIIKLNNLITEYNKALPAEKMEILVEIYHYQKEITDKYPASFNLNCPQYYQAFQIDLFKEMKYEFSSFGNHSMSKAAVNDFDRNKNKSRASNDQDINLRLETFLHAIAETDNPQKIDADLSYLKQRIRSAILEEADPGKKKILREIVTAINSKLAQLPKPIANEKDGFLEWIANMEAEKVTKLVTILLTKKNLSLTDRNSLCSIEERGKYDHYQITFLGGTRSRNFEVKGENGTFVLKVDNRWDAPKAMEARLSSHALIDTITPLLVDRVAVVEQPAIANLPVSSSGLVITEYCPGGDILSYREKQGLNANPDDLLKSTIQIFKQMTEILIQLRDNNVAFPDLKNINWLIDENGKLKIADTKSFLPAHDGTFNPASAERYWYRLLHTPHVSPPEITGTEPWDADAAHAYILGKNLYQFLTDCGEEYLLETDFFYHQPVFSTKEGAMLRKLIENLTHPDPQKRTSLENALILFNFISEELNLPPSESSPSITHPNVDGLKQECIALVDQIGQQGVGNDSQMAAFISLRKLCIEMISTETGLKALKQELEHLRDVSQTGKEITQEIESTIAELRKGAKELFSIGKGTKADKIEAALKNVPVERRHLVMDSHHGDKDLQSALASKRHFGKIQEVFYSDDKVANTFFKTKEKIEKIKQINE